MAGVPRGGKLVLAKVRPGVLACPTIKVSRSHVTAYHPDRRTGATRPKWNVAQPVCVVLLYRVKRLPVRLCSTGTL
eukprot:14768733-Heterocapsa_arctica.AAC.1